MIITININQPNTDYNWALVTRGVVINIIFADINFINNSGINFQYDYIVNLVNFSDPISAGWTYDSENNVFISPPVNYNEIFANSLVLILNDLNSALYNSEQLDVDIPTAITNIKSNNSLNAGSSVLWDAIKQWLIGGGL